jgi:DNA-binding MarR family transcriptional regulator
MKTEKSKRISTLMLESVFYFERIHNEIRKFGTDTELYGAEITMISAIEENEGIHVIGLADNLGITRSAASQTLTRLKRKGMIEKCTDPENQSRLIIKLSPKGKIVYRNHIECHKELEKLIALCLRGKSDAETDSIVDFLESVYKGFTERGNQWW